MKLGDEVYYRAAGRKVVIRQEFSTHFQCEDGGKLINCSKRPGVDLVEVVDGGAGGDAKPAEINVNAVTAEDLAKFLPALGKLSAKRIVQNKPEGGYLHVHHLKEVNPGLTINWEEVAPKLQF